MIEGSYLFQGYGAGVRVDVPGDISLSELRSQVAPELSVLECAAGPSDLHLTRWNGEYRLVYGERRYGPYRSVQNALRGLSNGIHFVIGKRSPLTFLHAGAVVIDGFAVVFPGRSRWGKSTLVSSLVEEGCGYLSDEYAVISPEGNVFPLSKPIRIRVGREESVDINVLGASAPGGFQCATVILTKYDDGASWNPVPLSRGEATLETLPSALQSRDEPDKVLYAVAAMVGNAGCYKGARGCGEPTAEMIRTLLDVHQLNHEARA